MRRTLPANTDVDELTDFEHLMGYLEDVVDTGAPPGDRELLKLGQRQALLEDDAAIDRILTDLIETRKTSTATEARQALDAAISYISKREDKMRYASLHAQNLAIGSGDTENTCWQMQQRVTRAGQSWAPEVALAGILTLRSLVLSERWAAACKALIEENRWEVQSVA